MIGSLILAAIAVLPADRLAMADRLFNGGKYDDAAAEYRALVGQEGIAADEIAFRIAECDRVAKRSAEALKGYQEVFTRYPDSRHAPRARFFYAMGQTGEERKKLLIALDSDRVEKEIRSAALYHLGTETGDRDMLAKCVRLDPKGKYAPYANLRYGTLLNASEDAAERSASFASGGITSRMPLTNAGQRSCCSSIQATGSAVT